MKMGSGKGPGQANLAKIHIAIKELQLPDETYRDILWAMFRKRSSAQLTPGQALSLIREFERRGWKPAPARKAKTTRPLAKDGQSRKIRALWLSLHELGEVRDPSEAALASYVRRMTGVDALQWLDGKQMWLVIESLKKWLERGERPAAGDEGQAAGGKR